MSQITVCRITYSGDEQLVFLPLEKVKRELFPLNCLLNFASTKGMPRSLVNFQCVVSALEMLILLKIHQLPWEYQLHHVTLDQIRQSDMRIMSRGSNLYVQYGTTTSRFQMFTHSGFCQLSNQLDITRGTNLVLLLFSTGNHHIQLMES